MTSFFDSILKWLLSDSGQLLTTGIAALLTLAIFSFLYKDNPFYKFAERLVAGVATGYWTMLLFWTNFTDKVLDPLKLYMGGMVSSISHPYTSTLFSPLHGFLGALIDALLIVIIPTTLGILMWTRFSRNYSWISRYSIAFYIGISSGLSIPIALLTGIFKQLQATIVPITFNMAGLNYLLITVAVLAALVYFFFSAAHKGTLGGFSRIGIYVIMIGFGAGFGLTVMGRVALLVQRVIFLKDYVSGLTSSIF